MTVQQFSSIFDGLKEAYGTYVVNKTQEKQPSFVNHGPRNYGRATSLVKAMRLELYQLMKTTTANGVVWTLTSTLLTTKSWSIKSESLNYL
jgi:hypothetical protein